MKRKKNILKEASVLLITMVMVFSTTAATSNTLEIKTTEKIVNEPCGCEQTAILSQGDCPYGMISYWKGDNTANDYYGTHHGTYSGSGYVAGKVSQAFSFSGGNEYVALPDHPDFYLGTGEFTFEAWINGGGMHNPSIILCRRTFVDPDPPYDTDGFIFGLYNNELFVQLDGINYLSGGTDVTVSWHHVAVTRDSDGLVTFYVDGASNGVTHTSNKNIDPVTPNVDWYIGKEQFEPRYWNGLIDEVAVYNKGLREEEILCHYNLGNDYGLGYCETTGTVHNIDSNKWFHWIQDAIYDLNTVDDHTIVVYNPDSCVHSTGMYIENVRVTKELTIKAADGHTPIVDGDNKGNVFYFRSHWVNLSGFTIQNALNSGVLIDEGRSNNTIENNVIQYNYDGVHLMDGNKHNTISNNTIMFNGIPIYFLRSSENSIFNNTIEYNEQGIRFHESIINTIFNNSISYQLENGIRFEDSSDHNLIHGNNITYNGQNSYLNGIIITSCKNNIITYNNITFNDNVGIRLVDSDSTKISCNNISSNKDYGIYMEGGSTYNFIDGNNFIDNGIEHAWDSSTNTWDGGKKWGGNYWGGWSAPPEYPEPNALRNRWRWSGDYPIPGGTNKDYEPLSRLSTCAPGVNQVSHYKSYNNQQSILSLNKLCNLPSYQQSQSFLILRYLLGV